MYYRILETDEVLNDLSHISFEAYNYTGDKDSGIKFLNLYDMTVSCMSVFPKGFSAAQIEYRGYEIHILPFGNYNLFQKQDWQRILNVANSYHINNKDL